MLFMFCFAGFHFIAALRGVVKIHALAKINKQTNKQTIKICTNVIDFFDKILFFSEIEIWSLFRHAHNYGHMSQN